LKIAKKRNLDVIGVTDHGTIRGGLETQKMKKDFRFDIMVVVGTEIYTNAGDIIGLFLNEEIRSKNVEEVIDQIRSQDGIVFLPHPFKGHDIALVETVLDKIDLVEFLNARAPLTPDESQQVADWGIPLVGFSDAHFAREIGLCRTMITTLQAAVDLDAFKKILTNLDKQTLKGSFSPPYYETKSQLIKSIKKQRCKEFPLLSLIHIRELLKSIKNRSFRLPDYSTPEYYFQLQ
jgi:predicted metal-dependent phosphoesterase TrpH